ncbi:MAG: ROK family protein [Wenzhouxiangellaceae bacterium]
MSWYAAIEAGGTKFVCGIADARRQWLRQTRIDTRDPQSTLRQVMEFFTPQMASGPPLAAGVASFGPLDLDPQSPGYGSITNTPKPDWANTELVEPLRAFFQAPVMIDTDVTAAALAEYHWGAGQGCSPVIYVTVGTGVGGGMVIGGNPVSGLLHAEMGHMRVARLPGDDFAGICPYHGDCIEGLVCGPAIAARCGRPAQQLAADDPIWSQVAAYLGQFAANLQLTLAPQKLIFGGGVMATAGLLTRVRETMRDSLNGYLAHPLLTDHDSPLLSAPALADRSGLSGALALALRANPEAPR